MNNQSGPPTYPGKTIGTGTMTAPASVLASKLGMRKSTEHRNVKIFPCVIQRPAIGKNVPCF